jgi:HAD superfamily hydrolase (TIGR01509 family)
MKTIIFDFFDVIRTDSYKGWLKKRDQPLEGRYLEINQKMDRGEIDVQAFLAHLGELTGQSPQAIEEEMEAATEINYDVLAIIEGLRNKDYKIGLLSNAPSEFIRDILKQHDLEQFFDTIVISSEVGLIKPEPEIFHYILKQMNVSASETIFIDDNPHNVKAAEEVGIQGLLFTSAQTLEVDLNKYGVHTGENQWTD